MAMQFQNNIQKKRFWMIYGIVVFMMIVGGFKTLFSFSINTSESLPQTLFFVLKNHWPEKGGFVVFKFPGKQFYSPKDEFVKYYKGAPGDRVETRGKEIYLNGEKVAVAKEKSLKGVPLTPLHFNGIIPPGKMFVMGESKDSYDSRYEDVGLVDTDRIVGAAYPIF
jgi:conjugal transfer pilin signal peptidase TrbI